MPVLFRPATKFPRTGDQCYAQGASSPEDSISSMCASRETLVPEPRRMPSTGTQFKIGSFSETWAIAVRCRGEVCTPSTPCWHRRCIPRRR